MFSVNAARCAEIGKSLAPITMRCDAFDALGPEVEDQRVRSLVFLYVSGICHQTESLRGTIDGVTFRGWDYLMRSFVRHAKKDPHSMHPASMRTINEEQLRELLSDEGVADTSTILDPFTRAEYLRDIACTVEDRYGADPRNMLLDGALGENGLYARMNFMKAFGEDPISKKSTVYFMLMNKSGIWPAFKDPQNLRPMPDYHKERFFLRTGCITVGDQGIARKLVNREKQDISVDNNLRNATAQAYMHVLKTSQKDFFQLEVLLWSFARSYCYQDALCEKKPVQIGNFEHYAEQKPMTECIFAQNCPKLIGYWQPIVDTTFH